MKERLRPRFNKNRREFLKHTAQGIASVLSILYLLRNEKIDRRQDWRLNKQSEGLLSHKETIEKHDKELNTLGQYMVADWNETLFSYQNDEALRRGLNLLAQKAGVKGQFVIEEGTLFWVEK